MINQFFLIIIFIIFYCFNFEFFKFKGTWWKMCKTRKQWGRVMFFFSFSLRHQYQTNIFMSLKKIPIELYLLKKIVLSFMLSIFLNDIHTYVKKSFPFIFDLWFLIKHHSMDNHEISESINLNLFNRQIPHRSESAYKEFLVN